MTATQSGYLLIADITGYTSFLSESELEHAQDTLSTLLELLMEHTRPPLLISRLAGDAVVSYALQENLPQGQTFVEMIEDTYVAFRKAIEVMVLNNTCQCNACANVSALDLKFFVHYGAFGLQRLGEHDELVGTDVNLIHRLLKNSVYEETGVRAYTLYTDAALTNLGLEDLSAGMTTHREAYEHLGEVKVWVQDMHPIWKEKSKTAQIEVSDDAFPLRFEAEIAMPPHLVWDYLTQPEFRRILIGSDHQKILNRKEGRIAPGSVYQCFHGDRINLQTVLEWMPFERMITEDLIMGDTYAFVAYQLEPTGEGTRLIQSLGRPKGPFFHRNLLIIMSLVSRRSWQKDIDDFRDAIEADLATRGGVTESAPPIPSGIIREAAAESLTSG